MVGRIRRIVSAIIKVLVGSAFQTVRQRHHPPETEPMPQPDQETPPSEERIIVQRDGRMEEIELPSPSVWPFVVGLGTALAFFGIVTSPTILIAGTAVLIWGIGGWIVEIRHG